MAVGRWGARAPIAASTAEQVAKDGSEAPPGAREPDEQAARSACSYRAARIESRRLPAAAQPSLSQAFRIRWILKFEAYS